MLKLFALAGRSPLGLLLAVFVGTLLFWPQQLILRYRKPWQGPLAWIWKWHGWGGWAVRGSRRGWEWRWGSLRLRGRWPAQRGERCSPRDWPYLWKLGKQLHIQSWQGGVEIGFADPALTGQCLGLVAALPPQLAQHLRLTFARIGWHGWGSLVIRLRGWQVLGLALKLGWLALSRHRKGSPAKIAHGTAGVRSKALGGELQR